MIRPIQLTYVPSKYIMESVVENGIEGNNTLFSEYNDELFNEAMFVGGKDKLQPIVESFDEIKKEFDEKIKEVKSGDRESFNNDSFIRSISFKKLEDSLKKVFGLRNVDIYHIPETIRKSNKSKGVFGKNRKIDLDEMLKDLEVNCYTYPTWRYPIDAVITDDGFYDKSRSINCKILITMGIINELSSNELTAVLLHELGHSIDPAIVLISYSETNILSKYMMDRDSKLTSNESKLEKDVGGKLNIIIRAIARNAVNGTKAVIGKLVFRVRNIFFNQKIGLNNVKKALQSQNKEFTRQSNQEAYADNFARMYGFGAHLTSGLAKMRDNTHAKINSRIKREKQRQILISDMAVTTIKDVHSTLVHRGHALIKEYQNDLKDPNLPSEVRKAIEDDMNMTKDVLDKYIKGSDSFTNDINTLIYEELKKNDSDNVKPESDIINKNGKLTIPDNDA